MLVPPPRRFPWQVNEPVEVGGAVATMNGLVVASVLLGGGLAFILWGSSAKRAEYDRELSWDREHRKTR